MIRQTRNYLKGALSGTALIVVAVVAFALLVSLQTLRDWPFAGLIGGSEAETSAVEAGGPQGATTTAASASATGGDGGSGGSGQAGPNRAAGDDPPGGVPTGETPQGADTPASSPGTGGATQPGSPGATSNNSGGGRSRQPSSGGEGGGSQPSGGGGESVSETVTGTVNDTVNGVDQATGGVLGETGVTQTTEEVIDGVAGPDSPVGGTADKVTKKVDDTVGDLLGEGD